MGYDKHIAISNKIFRFKNKEFRIVCCGIEKGEPYVSIEPENTELSERIKNELKDTGQLSLHHADFYICFPEDYPQENKN